MPKKNRRNDDEARTPPGRLEDVDMEPDHIWHGRDLRSGQTYRRVTLGYFGPWQTAKTVSAARARGYYVVALEGGGDASLRADDVIEILK